GRVVTPSSRAGRLSSTLAGQAEDAHMTLRGLSLGGERDCGGCIVVSFGIPTGLERGAGLYVLACLGGGVGVSLRNDLDEGGEGSTSFRRTPTGLVKLVGGHGWQSGWKPTDEAGVLASVMELAEHNRSNQGSLIRQKGAGG